MTLREVAAATGAAYRTVAAYAQKAGWTKNGVETRLDEAQVTAILEAMKQAHNGGSSGAGGGSHLANNLQGLETELSPALKLAALYDEIVSIKDNEIKKLNAENRNLTVALKNTTDLLASRTSGLGIYQRIAEYSGSVLTDREDVMNTYRRS